MKLKSNFLSKFQFSNTPLTLRNKILSLQLLQNSNALYLGNKFCNANDRILHYTK